MSDYNPLKFLQPGDKGMVAGDASAEFSDGIPEQVGSSAPSMGNVFDKEGAVGKQFKADGSIGQTADQVGGPFSKDGEVGKEFRSGGGIGGKVQEMMGDSRAGISDHQGNQGTGGLVDGAIGKQVTMNNPFGKDGIIGKALQPGDTKYASNTSNTTGDMANQASDKTSSMANQASDKTSSMADTAQRTAGDVSSKIGDMATTGKQASESGRDQPFTQREGILDKSVFDKTGAVGKEFEADGAIGGTAEKLGGPFRRDGPVGSQFTSSDGGIGEAAQKMMGQRK